MEKSASLPTSRHALRPATPFGQSPTSAWGSTRSANGGGSREMLPIWLRPADESSSSSSDKETPGPCHSPRIDPNLSNAVYSALGPRKFLSKLPAGGDGSNDDGSDDDGNDGTHDGNDSAGEGNESGNKVKDSFPFWLQQGLNRGGRSNALDPFFGGGPGDLNSSLSGGFAAPGSGPLFERPSTPAGPPPNTPRVGRKSCSHVRSCMNAPGSAAHI
jgi:hypothetical protein